MIGAYQEVPDFAYPGWRLTVPGGPAGGQYHGWTHNYSAGTDVGTAYDPEDLYELLRGEGSAAHDTVHVHPNAPRGVYRGPAEVPPRPNASGSAATFRTYQTRRGPGTSESPGSFPVLFSDSDESNLPLEFSNQQAHLGDLLLAGMGAAVLPVRFGPTRGTPILVNPKTLPGGSYPGGVSTAPPTTTPPGTSSTPPNTVAAPSTPPASLCASVNNPPAPAGYQWQSTQTDVNGCPVNWELFAIGSSTPTTVAAATGATSVVAQPSTPTAASQTSAPAPAPSVSASVSTASPSSSPSPSPAVCTGVVTADPSGSGNFIDAYGNYYTPSEVTYNSATSQYCLIPGSTPSVLAQGESWLNQQTIVAGWPNWYFVAGGVGLVALMAFMKRRR